MKVWSQKERKKERRKEGRKERGREGEKEGEREEGKEGFWGSDRLPYIHSVLLTAVDCWYVLSTDHN